eukprot:4245189-Pleurochrysis_carterae.AAC.1
MVVCHRARRRCLLSSPLMVAEVVCSGMVPPLATRRCRHCLQNAVKRCCLLLLSTERQHCVATCKALPALCAIHNADADGATRRREIALAALADRRCCRFCLLLAELRRCDYARRCAAAALQKVAVAAGCRAPPSPSFARRIGRRSQPDVASVAARSRVSSH